MTASTRSKLMFTLIIGLIVLPAEALLLPVARTPNPSVAALEWAASLDPAELRNAAAHIETYPGLYRKAIMGSMSPADRSDAWRAYFRKYAASHTLSAEQHAVIQESIDIASPEAFTTPVAPAVKERIGKVFAKAEAVLGKDAATELFVTLGPKEPVGASPLSLSQRLADRIRSWRVVSAAPDDSSSISCNCNMDIDTCDVMPDPWLVCSELYTCEFDLDWPMCGPLWCWACTGWCKIIRFPGGGMQSGGGN
jgi:hypothetical protein